MAAVVDEEQAAEAAVGLAHPVIVKAEKGEKLPPQKTPGQRQERAELREEALAIKIEAKYPDPVFKH